MRMFPRMSYPKDNIARTLKKVNITSSKVTIEDIKEKTDVRWIAEMMTAVRFGEISDIRRMNSEKPNQSSTTAIISKV